MIEESNASRPTREKFELGFECKQTTMPDAPSTPDELFASVRPNIVVDDATTDKAVPIDTVAQHTLSKLNDLPITLSNKFETQFITEYLPRIFPWTLQYNCGGPEFPDLFNNYANSHAEEYDCPSESIPKRWRRTDGECILSPAEHAQMLATRAEAHIGADWMLVPSTRNIQWRYQVLQSCYMTCKQKIAAGSSPEENLTALIAAAKSIFDRLLKGKVTINSIPRPIQGNIGLIFRADDITASEKILLRSYLKTTSNIAGCQALRSKIGHCLLGLRIVSGDCIFVTISPNRRHNTLVLRMSRARGNDTFTNVNSATARARKNISGPTQPPLFTPYATTNENEMEDIAVELALPDLPMRQKLNAQDPLSSVYYYLICMYVIVPAVFGTRI